MIRRGNNIIHKKILIILLIFSISIFFTGCTEKENEPETSSKYKVEMDSDLVELIFYDVIEKYNGPRLTKLDLEYLFKNIADRDINIKIFAEFYNKDNELLYTGGPNEIDLPKDYVEKAVFSPNIITFEGFESEETDRIMIIIEEIA